MVLFIPILFLFLFGIGIQILGRMRFNIVQSWIFAIIGSVLAWVSYLIVRIFASGQISTPFFPSGTSGDFQIIFSVGDKNWVFGFLWLSLLIPIMLMDSRRLTEKNNLNTWSGTLLIGASGLLAIMSGSVIGFLLVSALLDIQIFASHINIQKEELEVRRAIFEILFRIIGTLFLMFGFKLNGEIDFLLTSIGLALRSGVIPLASELSRTVTIRSNLLTLLGLVAPITCFAFMNQMQVTKVEFQGKSILVIILIFFIISNILKVLTKQQSQNGIRAWISAFSGLAVIQLINGGFELIQPLAIVFAILGALFSFQLYGSSRLKIAIIILMVCMIGLPYTPSYGIWLPGLLDGLTFHSFFYQVTLLFLMLVVFHSIISMPEKNDKKESWLEITTAMSPVILLISPWLLEIWFLSKISNNFNLVSPAIFLAILAFLIYFDRSEKTKVFLKRYLDSNKRFINFITSILEDILSLNWIPRGLKIANQGLSKIINIFVRVLEGDGGLLWAFVFLILISSILLSYRIIS